MENEYFIFAGTTFYPQGGFKDFKHTEHTYEDALRAVARMPDIDWYQIVRINDSGFHTIIDEGKRS